MHQSPRGYYRRIGCPTGGGRRRQAKNQHRSSALKSHRHQHPTPQYLSPSAFVSESLISNGCYIAGEVNHSIISTDAQVRDDAKVVDSIIMPGARIGKGASIYRAIVGENAVVGDLAVIEGDEEIAVVGNGEVIGVCSNED